MHVFDSPEERVDGREKFLTLMEELESTPLSSDASPMYQSEIRAQWMALLCLAPKRLRDPFVEMLRQGAMSPYDVAVRLKIPEAYISAISTDYYNKVLDHLVE
ncbi:MULTISPECIES: hypothetical protein [Methylosinus]|uniref:hypothetical protein n=1 Tax=Methylosinus TaxID=425 RepID=UPI0012DDC33D|nr:MULTISPECIES: hypothetical protein [Methylosinus]